MASLPQQGLIGVVLMLLGTVLFVPGVFPEPVLGSTLTTGAVLVLAAVLLTAGTWLFGTSEPGRPV
ncbi:hypothetical protein ACNS7O_02630 [Haloferacaceae archaeon DSL9]